MHKTNSAPQKSHVCPWWFIRSFDNPLRRLIHKPEKILGGIVRPNDHCLDLGCGFGYFTIPMARLVGPSGSVTAADLQPEMLAGVRRRAEKAGLMPRIRFHQVDASGLHLQSTFDFVLAFWMMHEVPDQEAVLFQIHAGLQRGGQLMIVEPKGHVNPAAFDRTIALAEKIGFIKAADLHIPLSRGVLFNRSQSES